MASDNVTHRGRKTEPTIEQIEAEIRRAKLEESPADAVMAAHARRKMLQERARYTGDKRLVGAYLAGFRAGQKDGDKKPVLYFFAILALCAVAIKILPALFN